MAATREKQKVEVYDDATMRVLVGLGHPMALRKQAEACVSHSTYWALYYGLLAFLKLNNDTTKQWFDAMLASISSVGFKTVSHLAEFDCVDLFELSRELVRKTLVELQCLTNMLVDKTLMEIEFVEWLGKHADSGYARHMYWKKLKREGNYQQAIPVALLMTIREEKIDKDRYAKASLQELELCALFENASRLLQGREANHDFAGEMVELKNKLRDFMREKEGVFDEHGGQIIERFCQLPPLKVLYYEILDLRSEVRHERQQDLAAVGFGAQGMFGVRQETTAVATIPGPHRRVASVTSAVNK